jgi:hypothetical protein
MRVLSPELGLPASGSSKPEIASSIWFRLCIEAFSKVL